MSVLNRLQGMVFGLGIGAAAKDAMEPTMEVVKQSAWSQRAIKALQAQQAAQADAQGIDFDVDYDDDAKRQGVGLNRYRVLRELARTWPGYAELMQLWRRDPQLTDEVKTALRRQGLSAYWVDQVVKLRDVLPTVTDMVRFAVREVYNREQRDFLNLDAEFPQAFAADAENIGLTSETAHKYWQAHWELPSYEQLNEMLFRKELTRGQYQDALKAIDYAPTWRGKLEAIARRIPTIPDMTRFAVREVYNPELRQALGYEAEYPEAFTAQAALHGMSEEHARQYWWAHWRLPSATQGYEMLHRGEIDIPELNTLLKALDYPRHWRAKLRNIAYRLPGRVDLRRMLAEDVIARDDVKRGYLDLGYTELWAERLTRFAEKLAAKSRATGDGISEPWASKATAQLWATLHRSYVSGETDDDAARAILTSLGVPDDEQLTVILRWDAERALVRKQLTPAQIKKAWVKVVVNPSTGVAWTRDEAIAALIQLGYSTPDAITFLDQ